MSNDNPWELYSSIPGWENASFALSVQLTLGLAKLDRMVATGTPVSLAANQTFKDMVAYMNKDVWLPYGTTDSEPRSYLAECIQRHIRKTHKVDYYVTRFGDVTDY